MAAIFTFNKQEKLKSKKLIESLFANGKSFLVFPVKVMYLPITETVDFPLKIGVTASSRNFKKAVDRNRIKRILREQYRLNKLPLHTYVQENNLQLAVFFMYIDKSVVTTAVMKKKMPIIINKLIQVLHETNTTPA
ncbi:MAG: ribonuclease P protein component [Chitinophagaceae bacterium]